MKALVSNIVVAVTGSDASIQAAKYAIVLAKLYRCKLSSVYVVDTATLQQLTLSRLFIQEESAEYEKSLQANGERYLSFVEELARAKGVKIERIMRKGAIDAELLAAADECGADLIVLGGWEKEKNTWDVLGHSHRRIMINAKCSVLLAKESGIDQIYKQT